MFEGWCDICLLLFKENYLLKNKTIYNVMVSLKRKFHVWGGLKDILYFRDFETSNMCPLSNPCEEHGNLIADFSDKKVLSGFELIFQKWFVKKWSLIKRVSFRVVWFVILSISKQKLIRENFDFTRDSRITSR